MREENLFKSSSEIAKSIVNSVGNGSECAPNKSALVDALSIVEDSEELILNLSNKDRVKEIYKSAHKGDKSVDIERLITSIDRRKALRGRRKAVISLILGVASVVGAISLWIVSENRDNTIESRTEVVAKAYTKPTLIIGDNKHIELELGGQVNGNKLSNVVINTKEKNIEYDSDEGGDDIIEIHTLVVPAQTTYSIKLSDGTKVTLNANSVLEYPSTFSDTVRGVKLVGEAYFDVAKSNKEFVVDIDGAEVAVYGTQFNINNTNIQMPEVVLVEGAVGFRVQGEEERRLKPNNRLRCDYIAKRCDIIDVDTEYYTAWRLNQFKFEEHSVYRILDDIAKWYGVKFIVTNRTNNKLYTLTMSRDITILEAINQITRMSGLDIINEGRGVYVIE